MDIADGLKFCRNLICGFESRKKDQVVDFPCLSVLFIDRTDLPGNDKARTLAVRSDPVFYSELFFKDV